MLKERFRHLNVSFPTFQNHLGILPLMLLLERLKIAIHFGILENQEIQANCKKTTTKMKIWGRLN